MIRCLDIGLFYSDFVVDLAAELALAVKYNFMTAKP